MMQTGFTATRNNSERNDADEPIEYLCKPWWTETAFESRNGRVCVARISATSLRYRYKGNVNPDQSGVDPERYMIGSEYTGAFVTYMLDLTQDEVDAILADPRSTALPYRNGNGVVQQRPKTNNPRLAVTSAKEVQRSYEWLQSEGYSEEDSGNDYNP